MLLIILLLALGGLFFISSGISGRNLADTLGGIYGRS